MPTFLQLNETKPGQVTLGEQQVWRMSEMTMAASARQHLQSPSTSAPKTLCPIASVFAGDWKEDPSILFLAAHLHSFRREMIGKSDLGGFEMIQAWYWLLAISYLRKNLAVTQAQRRCLVVFLLAIALIVVGVFVIFRPNISDR